jgi:hypothetical protein
VYTISRGMFEKQGEEEKKLNRTRHEKTAKIKRFAEEAKKGQLFYVDHEPEVNLVVEEKKEEILE